MDKNMAQSYVDVLSEFSNRGWRVIHLCPGQEYTIGVSRKGELAICTARYIVGTVLSDLERYPDTIIDTNRLRYLFSKLEVLHSNCDRRSDEYCILI